VVSVGRVRTPLSRPDTTLLLVRIRSDVVLCHRDTPARNDEIGDEHLQRAIGLEPRNTLLLLRFGDQIKISGQNLRALNAWRFALWSRRFAKMLTPTTGQAHYPFGRT
jgi:hypothetical protein